MSFDHDNSSKSLSSLGLGNHFDVQDFHSKLQLSIIHTYLLSYHYITTTCLFSYITTLLPSPPRNSSPVTLSLHPSVTPQPLISIPVAFSFQPSSLLQPVTFLPVTVQPSLSSVTITSSFQPSQNIHANILL